MGVQKPWEDALRFFEEKQPDGKGPVTRGDVAGVGSPSWIGDDGKSSVHQYLAKDAPDFSTMFDIWWSTPPFNPFANSGVAGNPTEYVYVVGCTMNWPMFDGATSPYNFFMNDPEKNLLPLVNLPNKNGNTDLWTFEHATDMLHSAAGWFDTWIPSFSDWANDLDQGDGEWQGSAAGEFKMFLNTVAVGLTNVKLDLTAPTDYAAELYDARNALGRAQSVMYNGYHDWLAQREVKAINAMHDAFIEAMAGAQIHYQLIYDQRGRKYSYQFQQISTPSGLDPATQQFWDTVQQNAKNKWLQTVNLLDITAHDAVGPLDDKYTSLAEALERGIIPPSLAMPQPGAGATGGLTDKEAAIGANDQAQKDFQDKLNKSLGAQKGNTPDIQGSVDGGVTGGATGGVGDGKGGFGDGLGIAPVSKSGVSGGVPILDGQEGDTSTDFTTPLLDSKGKPVLGKDNKPVMVPVDSTIGPDGRVYDQQGRPVVGADGNQVVAPPGSKIKSKSGSVMGGTSSEIHLPEGSKVGPDGSVVDAHGKQVLDANGNPYALPKGSSINANNVLVDEKGHPIDPTSQLLADQTHALLNSTTQHRPNTTSFGDQPGLSLSHGLGSGPGIGVGGATGGKEAASRTFSGTSPLLSPASGISDRAAQAGGDPTANAAVLKDAQTAAERQAAAAAEEHAQANQTATQQSPPMMPPMGGAGGGGGAPGGKDRQRTTWLAEDEEVWGTETGSVGGVIGR